MILGLQPLATLILLRHFQKKKNYYVNTAAISMIKSHFHPIRQVLESILFVIDLFHDLNKYNLKLYLVICH